MFEMATYPAEVEEVVESGVQPTVDWTDLEENQSFFSTAEFELAEECEELGEDCPEMWAVECGEPLCAEEIERQWQLLRDMACD